MNDIQLQLAGLYRRHYREILAPLIRILGSFEQAEEVVQEAFAQALQGWSTSGVPARPLAWIRLAAKNRAIDLYRRNATWRKKEGVLSRDAQDLVDEIPDIEFEGPQLRDDTLRLIFTCCHPSLSSQAQIALTLRTVCGLTTEQVARSFLVQPATLQQRVVRAKRKIEKAKIPYIVPQAPDLPERLGSVLKTVYLVFTEGHRVVGGEDSEHDELCEEGIRLGRILIRLMPDQAQPKALLALMLLHHARRRARIDDRGDLVTLEKQNRDLWDRGAIAEALPLVEAALVQRPPSSYALEAAIAAVHTHAPSWERTDWPQIVGLYSLLELQSEGSPVVALNAAVAVAMAGYLEEGLRRLDRLEAEGQLRSYHLLPAARGDILQRLGRFPEARAAFQRALGQCESALERRHLVWRLEALDTPAPGV